MAIQLRPPLLTAAAAAASAAGTPMDCATACATAWGREQAAAALGQRRWSVRSARLNTQDASESRLHARRQPAARSAPHAAARGRALRCHCAPGAGARAEAAAGTAPNPRQSGRGGSLLRRKWQLRKRKDATTESEKLENDGKSSLSACALGAAARRAWWEARRGSVEDDHPEVLLTCQLQKYRRLAVAQTSSIACR